MATEKPVRHGDLQTALPYRFHSEDLLTGVETLRVHGADSRALEAALRSKAAYVKAGLDLLGLIEAGTLELTALGRDLAYGRQDGSHQRAFLKILLAFDPFRSALTHFVASRVDVSDVDNIAAYWGRHRTGVSDKNRSEGALVFSHICQAAGVAKLVVGRSGEKSRLQWEPNAATQIETLNGGSPAPKASEPPPIAEAPAAKLSSGVAIRPIAPLPDSESFRLVTRQGSIGRLELPTSVDQEDLRALQAQIEAIFAFVRARLGVLSMTSASRGPGEPS
jgi:hypothetical protein